MQSVARFLNDVNGLTGAAGRIGIAVSGGPDSMALLWLAHQALPGRIEAATVDHGLRPEAADEARMVADWCAGQGILHGILRPPVPITGNIQSAARAARYALLEGWRDAQGLDWIATAHHADDQLETLLMRLNRGAGVGGLAGVRARNGRVIRPLLGWRRTELLDIAEAEQLPFVTDPSNHDPHYDRVALRIRLGDVDWIDRQAAARSAAALADADTALDWVVQDLAQRSIDQEGNVWRLQPFDGPHEIERRLILAWLVAADPGMAALRGAALDHLIQRLKAGDKASLGNWLLKGGPIWTLRPAPPRRTG